MVESQLGIFHIDPTGLFLVSSLCVIDDTGVLKQDPFSMCSLSIYIELIHSRDLLYSEPRNLQSSRHSNMCILQENGM